MDSRNRYGRRRFIQSAGVASLVTPAFAAAENTAKMNWPIVETREVDVLVAGGGMTGVFAAIGAKEPDINVVLIEPHNVLGGQGTAGGVAGICGDTKRVNAPFAELVAELEKRNLIAPYNPKHDRRPYDLESCAFFLQDLVLKREIRPLFHACAVSAARIEGTMTAVLVSSAGGLIEYHPKVIIDATGDCFVADYCGLETMHEGPNQQLPMSLYFTLWDTGSPVTPFLPPNCPTWEGDEDIPMTSIHRFPSGKAEVKMKVIGFDSCNGDSLSGAEIHARQQMMSLIYHLQTKGYRGTVYDRYVLASVSRQIGIRGARRIVGEHVLTEDEVKKVTMFDDCVAVGTYHIDYHWPDRLQRAGTGITTPLEPYPIPFRCFIPKGMNNLLVPGRGTSSDQMAMSSLRVMATCAQMGFAAGNAALLSVRKSCPVRSIAIAELQKAIVDGGQSLDLSDYGEYLQNTQG
ncbi:MAG TPA: FAD-dependent oxidoreductase [bacterium]|nr:FAD-dependent oxidoreductase [bacterium]HQP98654.1 FAD-dependent oxidoreductase [bacterium]